MSDAALLESLRRRVHDEVKQVVPRGPVALLDFPDYGNPGDSAIWLGALACLSDLGFTPPVYTSDQRTFNEDALRRALPTGTILLTGGGNLGDLWPRHQSFRERVLSGFPNHAIVQLPQSIHFNDGAALASARAAFGAHANVTLLVRDAASMRAATDDLGCKARLCPDLAFCLPPVPPPTDPMMSVLRLYRTDHESSHRASSDRTTDWVDDINTSLRRFTWRLGDRLTRSRRVSPVTRVERAVLSKMYTPLAKQRLERGFDLLRSARVVVTDRLHGHILALLLGVPHVVIGDRNGKLRGFYDTWTSSSSLTRWARSPQDAERMVSDRTTG